MSAADFKAAYDSVHRSFLIQAIKDINIPPKLISLTRTPDSFLVNDGLRKGDALSCLLFNIVLDKCMQASKILKDGTIFYKSVQVLEYADDLDIVSRSRQALNNAYLALESATQAAGMCVNQDKLSTCRF
ncbi:jg20521 [Pararge aegeria aegeria]|uniref:Jg20521 protein n=1 Tax=Pararge aegeria aegeria TaxID=348720 RepID=A0A8S4SBF5_9NEOP|nr:jg20521 [Pararge aegeria aegeria]